MHPGSTAGGVRWGPKRLLTSMDPNQGSGYSSRIRRIAPDGAALMKETPNRPPWKWPIYGTRLPHKRPRVHVIVMVGNHRFKGVLRRLIRDGCATQCLADRAGEAPRFWACRRAVVPLACDASFCCIKFVQANDVRNELIACLAKVAA